MKILFVCKYNRFRSKVAEAYFRKTNRNKNITAQSAGIFKGYPTNINVINTGKKFGIKIRKKTHGLKESYFKEFKKVIIVADNVPPSLFSGFKEVSVWKIHDCMQSDKCAIEKIMMQIFKKIDELNKELKNKK